MSQSQEQSMPQKNKPTSVNSRAWQALTFRPGGNPFRSPTETRLCSKNLDYIILDRIILDRIILIRS